MSPTTSAIRPADVAWRVGVLAHDSMAGRPTPSKELDAAAEWAARELERFGLVGMGDDRGGFIQRYPLPTMRRGGSAGEGEATAPNVVAVLPGADPDLHDEYVVFSAHLDHIGVGEPDATGDSIHNGADDDASGVAAVLEIAEAMAADGERPRRSLLFLLVSGEERGLWGSAWFAAEPTVPGPSIVANLNLDMVGRNQPDTIVAIGREQSALGETLERVADANPELGITAIDDPWPEESFYTRSDHFNFARRGVPVLFFFAGTHADYHGVDDEPERIDADKVARIAELVRLVGVAVANADARPAWDPTAYSRIVVDPY